MFNLVGDTGGVKSPVFQEQIARQMGLQVKDPENPSEFLYHLGDIVYHFGEREQYEAQFFKPYSNYPAPIFAIAGNHDGEVNPENPLPYQSLDAFRSVFCDVRPGEHYFSPLVTRANQHQPHLYWTMNTALATIIGLYSNVNKFGFIDEQQRDWFVKELVRAAKMRPEKAVIVCLHHSPYSADTNHGSSLPMITLLDTAFSEANVWPDIVFSGHVHNYQRFSKTYANQKTVPYIVAGAGGFDELHRLAHKGEANFSSDEALFSSVQLDNYALYQHGFVKVILEKDAAGLRLTCEYYTMPHEEQEMPVHVKLFDRFTLNL